MIRKPVGSTVSHGVSQIAAGKGFCLMLDWSGNIYSQGTGLLGELGQGTGVTSCKSRPGEIVGLIGSPRCTSIQCGDSHCAALTASGAVWMWGDNRHGQLGVGDFKVSGARTALQVHYGAL